MVIFLKRNTNIFMTIIILCGFMVPSFTGTPQVMTSSAYEQGLVCNDDILDESETNISDFLAKNKFDMESNLVNTQNFLTNTVEESEFARAINESDVDDVILCPNCQGCGKIEKEEKCKYCDGTGYSGYTNKDCNNCIDGIIMVTTTTKCTRCWGGKMGIIDPNCYMCGGTGVFKSTVGKSCSACDGKGYTKVRAVCTHCDDGVRHYKVSCSNCSGTGYIKNKYTITYDANGGTGAPENQIVKCGTEFTLSTVKPTHEKYDFLGWTSDKNYYYPEYEPGENLTVQNDTIFYAVWDIPHTIIYNANGGFDAPETQIKRIGKPLKISEDTPKYTGKVFLGWATNKTTDQVEYQPGDNYFEDKDITLYAVWKTTYSIEIHLENNKDEIVEYRSRYGKSVLHSVEIGNNGSYDTGELNLSLRMVDGKDASMFVLSTDSITNIESGAVSTFTVWAKTNIPGGKYVVYVDIGGDNIETRYIRFELYINCAVTVKACEGGLIKNKYGQKQKEITESIVPGNRVFLYGAVPNDENTTFDGYYVNGRKLNNTGYEVYSDCEIEARFSFANHFVTISSGVGGTVDKSGNFECKTGDDIILSAVSYDNYKFEGWYEYNVDKSCWELIGTNAYYRLYIEKNVKDYKIEARFIPSALKESFLGGEVIIKASDGAVPGGAVFDVTKIAPPPQEAVESVNRQYGSATSIVSYYEIRLKGADGEWITMLDGDVTIRIKYPDRFGDGIGLKILQKNSDGKLIEMESWIENGYICYKTNWLETY